MSFDDQLRCVSALEAARLSAYPAGQYVGQESFVTASELLALAAQAGVTANTRVLDLCCGLGGLANCLVRHTGAHLLGVDRSPLAIAGARSAAPAAASFVVGELPDWHCDRRFEVVMLLETVLAFAAKAPLLTRLESLLEKGGRLLLTLEEGAPLNSMEQSLMPHSDTTWLISLEDMVDILRASGLHPQRVEDHSQQHWDIVARLVRAFEGQAGPLQQELGGQAFDDLLRAHQLWAQWLESGRVRKFAMLITRA